MTELAVPPTSLPRDPLRVLPARPPGSVRRTTSVDILRPDGLGGDAVLVGRGRDLWTAPDGRTVVRGLGAVDLTIDYAAERVVRSISCDPPSSVIDELVGSPSGSGFRARVNDLLPDETSAGTVLHQLLDDVPGLSLIGGYASTITAPAASGGAVPSKAVDVCAGWQREGTMVTGITRLGRIPLLMGPTVEPFSHMTDAPAWHDMPELAPLGMRRHRMLEVTPGKQVVVTSWFRDVFRTAQSEDVVVHEYSLTAQVDPHTWQVIDAQVQPRVLPWLECPQAVPSVERLHGADIESLRAVVRKDFTGTSTCTHLNDQYRSLADIRVLTELARP